MTFGDTAEIETASGEPRQAGVAGRFFAKTGSPIGGLMLVSDGARLTSLILESQNPAVGPGPFFVERPDAEPLPEALRQVAAYFSGDLHEFDLPLALSGTDFQLQVWDRLRLIAFGETSWYGQIARQLGMPNGSRAVGLANAKNPIAIIVPCHRVVGSNGDLVGYAGGLAAKRALLEHERRFAPRGKRQEAFDFSF